MSMCFREWSMQFVTESMLFVIRIQYKKYVSNTESSYWRSGTVVWLDCWRSWVRNSVVHSSCLCYTGT